MIQNSDGTTSPITVADALTVISTVISAYNPALAVGVVPLGNRDRLFLKCELLLDRVPHCPQSIELCLRVSLGVLRFLLGENYNPISVHLPHDSLTPAGDYVDHFGCRGLATAAGILRDSERSDVLVSMPVG